LPNQVLELYLTSIETVPVLVREIYAIVAKLEATFPGRHFTPDGHLVGSLGEVLAAHFYGLELLPASAVADGDQIKRVQ
jgi:hypothetical protein